MPGTRGRTGFAYTNIGRRTRRFLSRRASTASAEKIGVSLLLYTAISRAKQKVILIGQKQAIFMAIHNSDVDKRNTVLSDRINAYYARAKR